MDDYEDLSLLDEIGEQKEKLQRNLKNLLSRKNLDKHELFMLMNEFDE